jgi:hypothetical protein
VADSCHHSHLVSLAFAANVARWLFFCLVMLCMDLCISVMYRSFSYGSPSEELAMIASSVFTAVGLSTGGFFVVRNQVPAFLIWLLYVSPFFWSVDAIANNEFSDARYSAPFDATQTQGEAFMATFAFPFGVGWKWMGVAILVAYYLLFGLVLQPLLLRTVRYDIVPGTQRLPSESPEEARAVVQGAAAALGGTKQGVAAHSPPPVVPMISQPVEPQAGAPKAPSPAAGLAARSGGVTIDSKHAPMSAALSTATFPMPLTHVSATPLSPTVGASALPRNRQCSCFRLRRCCDTAFLRFCQRYGISAL